MRKHRRGFNEMRIYGLRSHFTRQMSLTLNSHLIKSHLIKSPLLISPLILFNLV